MKKIYIVAFGDSKRTEMSAFPEEKMREDFIKALKKNNFSYCTTEAIVE